MDASRRPDSPLAGSPFTAADFALLRAAVLPVARRRDTWVDLASAGADQPAAIVAYLRRLACDPIFYEAITVASPSLARTLDQVLAGTAQRPLKPADLHRAALSVTKYLLRMATRPTPFGLMAGVTLAEFGEAGKVRLGTQHRKLVRPDRNWLIHLVSEWEQTPAVRSALRVVANPLCTVQGERLVLTYHVGGDANGRRPRRTTIRLTPAVRAVVARCRRPVGYRELLDHLCAAFPGTVDAAETMVGQLVAQGVLLTDLRPPATARDPLRHVLDRLTPIPEGAAAVVTGLSSVSRRIEAYRESPPGTGTAQWQALAATMRSLHQVDDFAQVDLGLDADVRLPQAVTVEIEQVAGALWRLHRPVSRSAHLSQYHADFLEKYGLHRLVPLLELLDPHVGLGAPATYQFPVSDRRLLPEPPDPTHHDLLVSIAQEAAIDHREVVLDETLLTQLAGEPPRDPPPPCDVYVHLLADSLAELDAGRFQLVMTPLSTSAPAGSAFGRFAYLLEGSSRRLRELAHAAVDRGHEVPVQLGFPPIHPRAGNVTQIPAILPHRLPVGEFADPGEPTVVDPSDVLVGAEPDRLYLVSETLKREIRASPFHMLNIQTHATNVARLIAEVADWHPWRIPRWNWGQAGHLPYLPRVRHGRTVVSSARWRFPAELTEPGLSEPTWRRRLGAWRERWRVPAEIQLTNHDQRIGLNLTVPLHLRLLRQELARQPDAVIHEPPGGGEVGSGWLAGHLCELVVPLLPRQTARDSSVTVMPRAVRQRRRVVHLPGGEWLYLKLYASPDRHDELLAEQLPILLSQLPTAIDRWFFLRYHDPDPHLRLRFHADAPAQLADWLPTVHRWADTLHREAACQRLVIDTYEPELDRYGGPQAALAAEQLFCADSRSTLEQLRLRRGQPAAISSELLAAANYVDLLRQFGGADWMSWLLRSYRKQHNPALTRQVRDRAIALLDPVGDWQRLAESVGSAALLDSWRARAGAVAAYGEVVRRAQASGDLWSSPDTVLTSILHMHHNRLVGTDPVAEDLSYALARTVVQAHLDRVRAWQRASQGRLAHDAR